MAQQAVVAAVDYEGRLGPLSDQLEFIPGDWQNDQRLALPLFLKLRLMTAGLASLAGLNRL